MYYINVCVCVCVHACAHTCMVKRQEILHNRIQADSIYKHILQICEEYYTIVVRQSIHIIINMLATVDA